MKTFPLLILVLAVMVSCNKDSSYTFIPVDPVILVPAVDSALIDRPELGDANTVRQFPYGPAKVNSGTLRLMAVKLKNTRHIEYVYDSEGKLVKKNTYAPDGKYRWSSTHYSYHSNSAIAKIEYWINVIGLTPESYPTSDELRLYSSDVFPDGSNEGLFDKITQRNEFGQTYYSPELLKLGFDKKGRYVWQARTLDNVRFSEYWTLRRAENGNISQMKYRNSTDSQSGNQITYTYDNQHNPFFTTGDAADWQSSNVNNVLTEEFQNNQKAKTSASYEYVYRPDGYPQYQINPLTKAVKLEFIYDK